MVFSSLLTKWFSIGQSNFSFRPLSASLHTCSNHYGICNIARRLNISLSFQITFSNSPTPPPQSLVNHPDLSDRLFSVFNMTASPFFSSDNILPRVSIGYIICLYLLASPALFLLRRKLLRKIHSLVIFRLFLHFQSFFRRVRYPTNIVIMKSSVLFPFTCACLSLSPSDSFSGFSTSWISTGWKFYKGWSCRWGYSPLQVLWWIISRYRALSQCSPLSSFYFTCPVIESMHYHENVSINEFQISSWTSSLSISDSVDHSDDVWYSTSNLPRHENIHCQNIRCLSQKYPPGIESPAINDHFPGKAKSSLVPPTFHND